jgi:hypothetical protein
MRFAMATDPVAFLDSDTRAHRRARAAACRMCVLGAWASVSVWALVLPSSAAAQTTPKITFERPVAYPAGGAPFGVAIGDLNRDGRPDLVTALRATQEVSVLLTARKGFAKPVKYGVGGDPVSVAIGDVNRDGVLDIVTATHSPGKVSVLVGTGGGAFADLVAYPVGTRALSLAVDDLNADGHADIAVTVWDVEGSWQQASVAVFLQLGLEHYVKHILASSASGGVGQPYGVAIGKMNDDIHLDLVVNNRILLGDGQGGFHQELVPINGLGAVFWGWQTLSIGDFSRGNGADVLASTWLYSRKADGTFHSTPLVHNTHDTLVSGVFADFNLDGYLDAAFGDPTANKLIVAPGKGTDLTDTATEYPASLAPRTLAAADMNGDGRPDLVYADPTAETLCLMLNARPKRSR